MLMMTEAAEGYSCRPESLYRSAEPVSPRKIYRAEQAWDDAERRAGSRFMCATLRC